MPRGWHHYWKSAGLRHLHDPVIDTLVRHAGRAGSPWSYALLFHLGGAVAEASPQATALPRRDMTHELNTNAVRAAPRPTGDSETACARAFAADLEHMLRGAVPSRQVV